MNICPNLHNKKVKLEFDELISIFGEDIAYYLWDESNGNGLELAPNGADSQLFKSLLEYYNGDRTKALIAKAKTYSSEFRNWFGDWVSDPENSSKVIDENGEPRIVYRGVNDNNYNKPFVYFSNSISDAKIYAAGLFTKGGNFYSNNKDLIATIKNYLFKKYGIETTDDDYLISIFERENEKPNGNTLDIFDEDGNVLEDRVKEMDKPSELYIWASNQYDLLFSDNQEIKDLLEMLYLIRNTTFTSESSLMRLYDDEYYWKDKRELELLLDKYNDVLNQYKTKVPLNIQAAFLSIKNPYTEELNSEDLINDSKAYLHKHDGAFLLNGEHFLVRSNSNLIIQIESSEIYSNDNALVENEFGESGPFDNLQERIITNEELREIFITRGWMTTDGYVRRTPGKHPFTPNMDKMKQYFKDLSNIVFFPVENDRYHSRRVVFGGYSDYSLYDNIPEEIQKSDNAAFEIINFLSSRFPNLTVVWHDANNLPEGINKNANSWVENGVVHLVHGRVNAQNTIEEFLHPFVLCIQQNNGLLFNQLYEEAVRSFPKLKNKIDRLYADKSDFVQRNELVTQALSRWVERERHNENKSTVSEIINKFFSFIAEHINAFMRHHGVFNDITVKMLRDSSLENIAKLIVSEGFKTTAYKTSRLYSVDEDNKSIEEISDAITRQMDNLYKLRQKTSKNATPEEISRTDKLFETILNLKHIHDYKVLKQTLQFGIDHLGKFNPNDLDSMKGTVIGTLYEAQLNNFDNITPQQVAEMQKNAIGFYRNLINGFMPSKTSMNISAQDRALLSDLTNCIDCCEDLWRKALVAVVDKKIEELIDLHFPWLKTDDLDENGVSSRAGAIIVMKDWIHKNSYYGDVSSILSFITNYTYAETPVVRMGFLIINEALQQTRTRTLPIQDKLTKAFNEASRSFDKTFKQSWLEMLMEKDDNGVPTGNFLTPVNQGLYEKDYEKFLEQLSVDFESQYGYYYLKDEAGNIVRSDGSGYAEDEEWTQDANGDWIEPVYYIWLKAIIEYQLEEDRLGNTRCNMRYTKDYYLERMSAPYRGSFTANDNPDFGKYGDFDHGLSPKTLAQYNRIQSNINYYLDKSIDEKTGLAHPELLTKDDKEKLDYWKYLLKQLSSIYIEGSDEVKEADDLIVAMEIKAWEKWISLQQNTSHAYDQFEQELNDYISKANDPNYPDITQQTVDDFIRYNSDIKLNPDLMRFLFGRLNITDIIQDGSNSFFSKIIRDSQRQLVSDIDDIYNRNFEGVYKDLAFWVSARRSDQYIEDARFNNRYETKHSGGHRLFVKDVFYDRPILYKDDNGMIHTKSGNVMTEADYDHYVQNHDPVTDGPLDEALTQYEYVRDNLVNYIWSVLGGNVVDVNDDLVPKKLNSVLECEDYVYDLLHYSVKYEDEDTGYINEDDSILTIFSQMVPKSDYVQITDEDTGDILFEGDATTRVPKGRFAEKTGPHVNDNFQKGTAFNQQANPMFKNGRYDNSVEYWNMRKNKKVSKLYDLLIKTMKDSQSLYKDGYNVYNYSLPQINATNTAMFSRLFKNGFKNTMSSLWESMTTVLENDVDMRSQKDLEASPDGSKQFSLLRYITKIDPSTLSTNVTGMVIMFAHMAINYQESTAVKDLLSCLQYCMEVDKRNPGSIDAKNSFSQFKAMVDTHLYDSKYSESESQEAAPEDVTKIIDERKQTTSAPKIAAFLLSTIIGAGVGAVLGFLLPYTGFAVIGGILGGSFTAAKSAKYLIHQKNVTYAKAGRMLHRTETLQMLAWHTMSMMVGFLDSEARKFSDAFSFKYMTPWTFISSFITAGLPSKSPKQWDSLLDPEGILGMLAGIGSNTAPTKLGQIMRLHDISTNLRGRAVNVNLGRVRRFADNLLMGGFSLLDYWSNAIATKAIYKDHVFYDGDEIPKGFYSSFEMRRMFNKLRKDSFHGIPVSVYAQLQHAKCMTNLYDAYTYKDGVLKVKPEYEQYVTNRLITKIGTTIHKRTALYNGVNPDNDTPRYKKNPAGNSAGAMRGWVSQNLQEQWSGKDDINPRTSTKVEEQRVSNGWLLKVNKYFRNDLSTYQKNRSMGLDWQTGACMDATMYHSIIGIKRLMQLTYEAIMYIFTKGKRKVKTKISVAERSAIRTLVSFLFFTGLMGWYTTKLHDWASNTKTPPSYTASSRVKEGYDSNGRYHTHDAKLAHELSTWVTPFEARYYDYEIYKLQADLLWFRTVESRLSVIDYFNLTSVVNDVTVLKTGLEEHMGSAKWLLEELGLTDKKPEDIITANSKYKNHTRRYSNMYRTIGPLDNVHSDWSYYGLVKSMGYYTNQYGAYYKIFGYNFNKKTKDNKDKNKNKELKLDSFNMNQNFNMGDFDMNQNFDMGDFDMN